MPGRYALTQIEARNAESIGAGRRLIIVIDDRQGLPANRRTGFDFNVLGCRRAFIMLSGDGMILLRERNVRIPLDEAGVPPGESRRGKSHAAVRKQSFANSPTRPRLVNNAIIV